MKALKTGTKALIILTILIGALATSVIALPTFADPIRERDQLQDQLRDQNRLQTCEGNGDGNCTRAYNCAGGSNQGTGMQERFQWQFGSSSQGEGAAMYRYDSCGSMNKGK